MTQTLLADGFKLSFHRQIKEMPAYVVSGEERAQAYVLSE
jgi:uncharacterized protein (TIGR03435 family)